MVISELRNFFASFKALFKKTEGYTIREKKPALPTWVIHFKKLTSGYLTKTELNNLVSETRAFKGYFLWNKHKKAIEQLKIIARLLEPTDRYVIEAYTHLTKIPINEIIYKQMTVEDVYDKLRKTEFRKGDYLAEPEGQTTDVKSVLESRWKEKLWNRFQKDTHLLFRKIEENDIFHAESILMDLVFTFDALRKDRAKYINDKYIESFNVDFSRLLKYKTNEKILFREFIKMLKDAKMINNMINQLIELQNALSENKTDMCVNRDKPEQVSHKE